ncbi:transcriptional regulator [Rhizobium sp. AC44/96]|uniref:LysR substrate-binding domain-containing protein n=1 Tax=Rhizobium sp. AC44/96 TaxID=1841654 RepID=UPI00080F9477|nr:LysR substrate-binding domain-containing protein [Rhizobium sp. AC44/96]OCJ09148.1 transcriptional regulator [Rhizobium sp. AC44/96]
MKRGHLPLTALRSFEVAGRLGSFTRAADELFISQAAVSRQIRDLETTLGEALFERRHRSVHLTDDGHRLLTILTTSFDKIGDCLDGIRSSRKQNSLSISAEPSFAASWLVPQLPDFQALHADIDVTVDSDSRLAEFRSGEAQIAIRHSVTDTSWPRSQSRHLADVWMIPVAAPVVLTQSVIRAAGDLLSLPLLHEENRDVWNRWFEAAGVTPSEAVRGVVYADGGLVLQAVLRGQGIGLVDRIFAEDEIRAGRLACVFDLAIPHGAYFLVARRFDQLTDPARLFSTWITSKFQ